MIVFAFDLDGKLQVEDRRRRGLDQEPSRLASPRRRSTAGTSTSSPATGWSAATTRRPAKPKWARQMGEFGGSTPGWGYAESVLIYDNLAIVTPGGENCIVALDKTSGKPVWTQPGLQGRGPVQLVLRVHATRACR